MQINSEKFDKICLILSGIFVIGTLWVWRANIVDILALEHPSTLALEKVTLSNSSTIFKIDNKSTEKNDNLTIRQFDNEENKIKTAEIEKKQNIPNEFNLQVPFTSQAPEKNWDQPWQDACEEAALLMLDAYYKNYNLSPLFAKDELLKIINWEKTKGWGNSIEIEKVKQIADEYFHLSTLAPEHLSTLRIKILENPTVDDIKKSIAAGNPVLAVADGKVLPNPHFRNGGPVYHSLIIKGYDEENFFANDPGTQFGADFRYKYDDLLNAIHDWNNGDVKNGQKVILVVE